MENKIVTHGKWDRIGDLVLMTADFVFVIYLYFHAIHSFTKYFRVTFISKL